MDAVQAHRSTTVRRAETPANDVVPPIDAAALQATTRSLFFIRRLHLDAKLGLCDWERVTPQPIVVDMEFQLPTGRSCLSDRLEDTIDHRALVERIREHTQTQHYDLIEAMAEGFSRILEAQFGVNWATITITKQRPFPATEVGITIERGTRKS